MCHTKCGPCHAKFLTHCEGHLRTAAAATHQQHCVRRCIHCFVSQKYRAMTAASSSDSVARCMRQGVEAALAVCPAMRNRRQGIPAHVLEYADMIPANAVERAALKPLLLAGAQTTPAKQLSPWMKSNITPDGRRRVRRVDWNIAACYDRVTGIPQDQWRGS